MDTCMCTCSPARAWDDDTLPDRYVEGHSQQTGPKGDSTIRDRSTRRFSSNRTCEVLPSFTTAKCIERFL
jgi:hypothetical protein